MIDKISTLDARAGTKVGTKKYIKEEESEATRIGTQISKAFTIQKVTRVVTFLSSTVKYKDPSGETQTGYTVTPAGGSARGPIWPYYLLNGEEVADSAYMIALGAIKEVVEE